MLVMSAEFLKNMIVCRSSMIVCIGFLLVLSGLPASSTPASKTELTQKSVSLPRNYCSADVATLGTGLVLTSSESGSMAPTNKERHWVGWIRGAASGRYALILPNISGRILVSQQQIFVRSEDSSKTEVIPIELLTNRYYAITVEALGTEDATLPLQWRRPDGRQENVPKEYLYAPVAMTGGTETKTAP